MKLSQIKAEMNFRMVLNKMSALSDYVHGDILDLTSNYSRVNERNIKANYKGTVIYMNALIKAGHKYAALEYINDDLIIRFNELVSFNRGAIDFYYGI